MTSEATLTNPCVYILKTGKNLYKIGKTRNLRQRLSGYHTHLPVLFRVIRQYPVSDITGLEQNLHIVFQHKRVKGEWFELNRQDLIICDNIARYITSLVPIQSAAVPAHASTQRAATASLTDETSSERTFSNDPLLQVISANEKYLSDYSRVAEDIRLGLSTQEIVELHEGAVSKATIQTVRRLLEYQTPNSAFLHKWMYVVQELETGATEDSIIEKYSDLVNRSTIRMIRRILRNQLF